jgi:predicted metal-dependent hydrolase
MKKNDRISAFVQQLGADPALTLDPRYQGYFTCFNAQQYYEAHDVLEHLWLEGRDENYQFFKGLIQVAGAFVHLQKQFHHPEHLKHGRRLRPAVRLFRLGVNNLAPFGAQHLRLDVQALCQMCERWEAEITASEFRLNPWQPSSAPQLQLLPA